MRTELTSPANPRIKHVVKLRSCSAREESGEMIVEGFRECRRALDNGYRPQAIYHCPELYLKNENEAQLVADAERAGADVFTCSRTAFVKMAYKERPDGLLMTGPHVAKRLADIFGGAVFIVRIEIRHRLFAGVFPVMIGNSFYFPIRQMNHLPLDSFHLKHTLQVLSSRSDSGFANKTRSAAKNCRCFLFFAKN